ncbi:META domain-containing protein [Seonamhaeicola sediminis]|uniref:META domain-containing protein n=1 Tax=Seonamhaeicola sediminis TaxID=2528206 RepID=A0A562YDH0_9FLAO|nr:META domain-containing protein [Seonamhaeicola sediminis]TWO32143.1 META domain-containing protein [Seonamhaeicola sediminis]
MKYLIMLLGIIVLRCCWGGSSDFTLMMHLQNNSSVLKELNGNYNIIQLKNENVLSFKLKINFNKDTKEVSGFSGCNRFFGSYSHSENKLSFGKMGSTRMLCDNEKNNIETSFLKALQKANLIVFNDNGFSLFYNKKLLMIAEKEAFSTDVLSFEYKQHSRNGFQFIKINSKSISVQNKRDGVITKIKCNDEQWKKLIEVFRTIDIKTIPNLEAPSQKRLFDGAAIAKFTVTVNGKSYETQSFDHGNPHSEIENLVKEILSIAQNIE